MIGSSTKKQWSRWEIGWSQEWQHYKKESCTINHLQKGMLHNHLQGQEFIECKLSVLCSTKLPWLLTVYKRLFYKQSILQKRKWIQTHGFMGLSFYKNGSSSWVITQTWWVTLCAPTLCPLSFPHIFNTVILVARKT